MYLSNIYIYAYCYSLNKHAWLPSEVCCSFKVYLIYHHILYLQRVVALLSLCICAGLLKHFLGADMQKAYFKFNTCFGALSKGPGQPVYICAVSPEPSRSVWTFLLQILLTRVCNCPGVWCASAKSMRPAKAAQMFVLIWKCRPWTMILLWDIST